MAVTSTWSINDNATKRLVADDYIIELVYRVDGVDDTSNTKYRSTGSVQFTKPSSLPSDFIAFESVTKDNAIAWVKAALGSDQVTATEANIATQIGLIDTPVEKVGAPTSWG
tara:strand:- start:2808 stop:3143 length:336 start_codon:yes stop_codon:yes gene_type:complete